MKLITIIIILVFFTILFLGCKKEHSDINYVRYVVDAENECNITWLDKKGYHTILQKNGQWATEFKTSDFPANIYLKVISNSNINITVYYNGSFSKYKEGRDSLIIK